MAGLRALTPRASGLVRMAVRGSLVDGEIMRMPLIEFRNVSYDIAGRRILSNLNLSVEAGETLVLLGRSGSGKSTALKLTNGMLFPTEGQVLVEGRSTREWDPIKLKRHIGYVIQDVGLFPHFNVARNVGLVPRLEGWAEQDIERRVDQLLQTVGMPTSEFGADIREELSGGQRQRVGVARALAAGSAVASVRPFSFGALDPVTRFGTAAAVPRIAAGIQEDLSLCHPRCAGKPFDWEAGSPCWCGEPWKLSQIQLISCMRKPGKRAPSWRVSVNVRGGICRSERLTSDILRLTREHLSPGGHLRRDRDPSEASRWASSSRGMRGRGVGCWVFRA